MRTEVIVNIWSEHQCINLFVYRARWFSKMAHLFISMQQPYTMVLASPIACCLGDKELIDQGK